MKAPVPAVAAPGVPLASSLVSGSDSWAALPMGQLSQPLNTFWQLLRRSAGPAGTWSDDVEATGVATNGGIVIAGRPGGRTVAAAVLPSDLLRFSPVIASSDGGASWSQGLVPAGVAGRSDALALGAGSGGAALVAGGAKVLVAANSLTSWTTAATEASLAGGQSAQACGLTRLTAVADVGGSPVVAGACSRPGVVGIFAQAGRSWRAAGPALPASDRGDTAEVLGMRLASGRLTALVALTGPGRGGAVIAAWSSDGGRLWSTSPTVALPGGASAVSVGSDRAGWYLLTRSPAGALGLVGVPGPGTTWSQLAEPPAGTEVAAFPPGAAPQALAVNGTTLTVSDLGPLGWKRGQVLQVPIQYGTAP